MFDGSILEIPVTVSGTNAGLIFSVFTDYYGGVQGQTQNGYLGWHYVNGVDTCIYYSPIKNVQTGDTSLSWDGRDQDGSIMPVGKYRYYIWAFDNQGAKQPVLKYGHEPRDFARISEIQEIDEFGLPLAQPIWYQSLHNDNYEPIALTKWSIGGDPDDYSLLMTSMFSFDYGWSSLGDPKMQSDNFDNFILRVGNSEDKLGSMLKVCFVPDGELETIDDWGDDSPYATFIENTGGESAGVTTDGEYLYTTDGNITESDVPYADFYIYDMDGFLVDEIDLSPWWSSDNDYAKGGQMNGGPDSFSERNGKIFLNSHASCLNQMIDPRRYLESGEYDDLFVWSNGNGDYTLDKNFEETSVRPWVCNDFDVGPYKWSISADDNLFSAIIAYDAGAVSFGLFAPDGTGLGYHTFAGETAGIKHGVVFIDNDTPFDGLYCDNNYKGDENEGWCGLGRGPSEPRLMFLGHDSISGSIGRINDCFGAQGHVILTWPNGGEDFKAGSEITITWMIEYGCYLPDYVRPEFSLDNGKSWGVITNMVRTEEQFVEWRAPNGNFDKVLIRLTNVGFGDTFDESDAPFSITSDDVAVAAITPHTFTLSQNSPNPFNPATSIPFTLGLEAQVSLAVYNIAGEKVAALADGRFSAGAHSVIWDASGHASGVYFYRIVSGDFVETRKMMLVK